MTKRTLAARKRARRRLAALPAHAAVFEHCLESLSRQSRFGVAVFGSLAGGRPDRLSDLDLALVRPDRRGLADARRLVLAALAGAGELAGAWSVPAPDDHQLVFLLRRRQTIVKVDVHVVTLDLFAQARVCLILHDPAGRLAAARRRRRPKPAVADLAAFEQRALGALWDARVRIARGDRLEAADALARFRDAALPCLLAAERRSQASWRALEGRLSARRLRALRATFPRGLQARELRRSLRAAARLLRSAHDDLPRRRRGTLPGFEALLDELH